MRKRSPPMKLFVSFSALVKFICTPINAGDFAIVCIGPFGLGPITPIALPSGELGGAEGKRKNGGGRRRGRFSPIMDRLKSYIDVREAGGGLTPAVLRF